MVAVILDSPVAPHIYQQEGGWVAAPVFQRIAQAVLEYLHTPHDIEVPPNRQILLAERNVKPQDLAEGSPDRLGENVDVAAAAAPDSPAEDAADQPEPSPVPAVAADGIVPAALREPEATPTAQQGGTASAEARPQPTTPAQLPARGTVVLEVEQGGIVVPSFLGQSVRAAVETAERTGLDVDVVGSGVAREQSPAAGSHVAAGATVMVRFAR
jgi:cell division protein FtsI (penicillin-binding protein 3)